MSQSYPTVTIIRRTLEANHNVVGFAVIVALILALPQLVTIGLATEILILGIFVLSYNLMFGFSGLLSFGHALFLGMGAYIGGLIILEFGTPLIGIILIALLLGTGLAVIIGTLSLRLGGIAFAMITLGFAQLGYKLVFVFDEITGGDNGVIGIYRTDLLGLGLLDLADPLTFYVFVAVVTLIVTGFAHLLSMSLFGRTLRAIRENEERTRALGVNTYRVKVTVFSVAGGLAAISGVLWVAYLRFISPNILYWTYTGDALIASMIGGMYSIIGPFLGISFMRGSDRLLFQTQPGLENIVIGSVFIILVLVAREGIVGIIQSAVNRILDVLSDR
jgi:branched-chain amino acid transport system permease protein